jgi:hypothetical protein
MSEMSQFLAEYYGTNGTTKTASAPETNDQDDLVKKAQVELFCKVAAEQKIDLASMPDDQVQQLFDRFIANTTKVASEDESKKKDEAEKELEEKKAAAAEFAKYDFFGRQMAHAYVDELRKIAAAAGGAEKVAAFPPGGFPFQKKEEGGKEHDDKKEHEHDGKDDKDKEKDKEKKGSAPALAAGKAKKASAIDELAFKVALQKIAEARLDPNEAASRINAAVTLELLGESTKIAAAQDVNTAIEIRALEMLEAARYPVEWAKPTTA